MMILSNSEKTIAFKKQIKFQSITSFRAGNGFSSVQAL